MDLVGPSGAREAGRLIGGTFKPGPSPADPVAMATWLRRMFRPTRKLRSAGRDHEGNATRALDDALAEAEEWAAHAVALARVLRETKAAARSLDRTRAAPAELRAHAHAALTD